MAVSIIDRSTPFSGTLASLVQQLRSAQASADMVKQVVDNLADGTEMQAVVGVPQAEITLAQLSATVDAVVAALDAAAVTNMTSRLV